MKVKTLIKKLSKYDENLDIEIYGCYASIGYIEKVRLGINKYENKKIVVLESDICTG